jgi:transcriptional regulator with XRE-family HTH domain
MYAMADRDVHRAGIFVQARRGELGMTQEQLAVAAGVDEKTIRTLESGVRWPWTRNRAAIEQALGWPPLALERIAAGDGPSEAASELDMSVLTEDEMRVLATFIRLIQTRMAERDRESRRGA